MDAIVIKIPDRLHKLFLQAARGMHPDGRADQHITENLWAVQGQLWWERFAKACEEENLSINFVTAWMLAKHFPQAFAECCNNQPDFRAWVEEHGILEVALKLGHEV